MPPGIDGRRAPRRAGAGGAVALGVGGCWRPRPARRHPRGAAAPSAARAPCPSPSSPWDWPTYGHDAQHTFHGRTTLTQSSVRTLQQAWFFPTGDAVTATPTVVGGTVYVGLVGRLLLRA